MWIQWAKDQILVPFRALGRLSYADGTGCVGRKLRLMKVSAYVVHCPNRTHSI